jgi:hypothetical protein
MLLSKVVDHDADTFIYALSVVETAPSPDILFDLRTKGERACLSQSLTRG